MSRRFEGGEEARLLGSVLRKNCSRSRIVGQPEMT